MSRSVGTTAFLLAAFAALVAGLFAWRMTLPPRVQAHELEQLGLYVFEQARPLPRFEVPATRADSVSNADLRDRWTILFFGFTHCPDVCPTTLADISATLRSLPETRRERLRVWMASVDPARDSLDHLRTYLAHFDPEFVGLRAPVAEMAEFARLFNAVFARVPGPDAHYQVDHSAHLALVNPRGEFAAILRAPVSRDGLRRSLELLLDHYPFTVVSGA